MRQQNTPLYAALAKFSSNKPISMHVPGHKNGLYFPKHAKEHFHSILDIDVTELAGLDDLHAPSGCIAQAQQLLADLYDADDSYFLINGSTVGNLAMILAVCKEGDLVLVQRNCHKSVIHGLELAGVIPVFLHAEIDAEAHVATGVSYETLCISLQQYPQAKAIILTHPNYYGMAQDLRKAIELAHIYQIPVLVDEAHGAHFCLGDPFPMSALACGADVVVHSAHKTLPAMTMGSYLHVKSKLIDTERIARYLSMLQSSSPSYPIMASLDVARFSLAALKEAGTEEILAFIQQVREKLMNIKQITVLSCKNQDPLKVILQTRCSLSGYELQHLLEQKGIYTELADPYNVLLVLPLYVSEQYVQAVDLIEEVLRDYPVRQKPVVKPISYSSSSIALPFSYKQLQQCQTKVVAIQEAKGYIAEEMIIPYPPGIPLIMKGERITVEHIAAWRQLQESGARFQGSSLLQNGCITVYDIEEERER